MRTRIRMLMLGLALGVVVMHPPPAAADVEEGLGLEFIGADELRRLQRTPRRILVVDVRSPEEFRESHIKGAVNVPVLELERRFSEIPRQGLVVLY